MGGRRQRQGTEVAKRAAGRLNRAHGWRGVTRARRAPRATAAGPAASRAPGQAGLPGLPARGPARGGLHLRAGEHGQTRLHGVRDRRGCRADPRTGMLPSGENRVRCRRDPPGRRIPGQAGAPAPWTGKYIPRTPGRNQPALHQDADARRAAAIGRNRRGRVRQHPRRNHYRALQDRMRPGKPTIQDRPPGHTSGPGDNHRRRGALAQHQQAHAPPRPQAPSRSRGPARSPAPRHPPAPGTQVTRSASNPGRFNPGRYILGRPGRCRPEGIT
jgi:hypothetical protein